MSVLILILLVLLLLVFRQPVMIILGLVAAYIHWIWGDGELIYLVEDLWLSVDKEALLSIPMFILVGAVMTRGSLASRLIDLAIALTARMRSGMGVASIISCAIFAAISGSSPVTLIAVGSILYPALCKQGYDRGFSLGALSSGATLGIIIPPSIPLILYGIATETSIVSLFTAGIIPGLILTVLLAGYAWYRNRNLEIVPSEAKTTREVLIKGAPALGMPVLLLGGIYTGFFTPTESAAVALVYAILVEIFLYRELKIQDLAPVVQETVALLGSLIPIIAISASLNILLTTQGVPSDVAEFLQANIESKWAFLAVLTILLLIVGCLVDTVSAILILAPLLVPIAQSYGIDPIHLGIVMIINLEIGLLTPPMGLNLLVASGTFKEPFALVVRSVLPFIALMLFVLILITYIPALSLALI